MWGIPNGAYLGFATGILMGPKWDLLGKLCGALLGSMWASTWDFRGMYLGFMWDLRGIMWNYVGFILNLCGMYVGFMRANMCNIFCPLMAGLLLEFMWAACSSLHIESFLFYPYS